MKLTTEIARKLIDLNPYGNIDSTIAERQFQVIVKAFNYLNSGNQFIYIADEVGLGKTYIALGITSLLRHFSIFPEQFNDLILVPKKNLQYKWQKEIKSFITNNYIFPDNRVKSVINLAVGKATDDEIHDHFGLFSTNYPAYHLFRISSFSMGWREPNDWYELFETVGQKHSIPKLQEYYKSIEIPNLDEKKEYFNDFARRLYAYLINIDSPKFNCIIVDEAHNFRKGIGADVAQRNKVMSRYMGVVDEEVDDDIFRNFPEIKHKIKPLADKIIFLSATPINRNLTDLKNQLDVFLPDHSWKNISEDKIAESFSDSLSTFLVRGVMNIKIQEKVYSRNMYRHEHRNGNVKREFPGLPIKLSNNKHAIITGLVQYKTMKELDRKNNPSFEIGLLAGFESFQPKSKKVDADFEDENASKEAEDSQIIGSLADSYYKTFKETLPHLKQDVLVDELFERMLQSEKSLVFVRRISSVNELERKLLDKYEKHLFHIVSGSKGQKNNARLDILIKAFNERTERKAILNALSVLSKRIFDSREMTLSQIDIYKFLIALYDKSAEEEEDSDWIAYGSDLKSYQNMVYEQRNLKRRVGEELKTIAGSLLSRTHELLLDEIDPDDTIDSEEIELNEINDSVSFFHNFFKTKGFPFKSASYSYPWFELNLILFNERFSLFDIDTSKLSFEIKYKENDKEARKFRLRQDVVQDAFEDYEYQKTEIPSDYLESTFITSLLLELCFLEVQLWTNRNKKYNSEDFFIRLNYLIEILKGIFRNGSGALPAYIAWSTKDFDNTLIRLLENEFDFVLTEIKSVINDFEKILNSNFPDPARIKYTLYNQFPVLGASGQNKINVSKVASQFRMPGYPYILIATDILKEGEDLHTYCSEIYHYGVAWNPSDMEQRTGRIDRIGSKCYHQLVKTNTDYIPNDSMLQVFYPYLSDTLEVNQVAKVFAGMNSFIDTFYDFTQTKEAESSSSISEVVTFIPKQITEKLESKYDIDKFNPIIADSRILESKPVYGKSKAFIYGCLEKFAQRIKEKHVDSESEYVRVDKDSLRIKGMIFYEENGGQTEEKRQCPFQISVINHTTPGNFSFEILSPIARRSDLRKGSIITIKETLNESQVKEINNIIYARAVVDLDLNIDALVKELNHLIFMADQLENEHSKGDLELRF